MDREEIEKPMENDRLVIIGKIPTRRTTYTLKPDDILIAVRDGRITGITRGLGKQAITHDEGTEWYFVDGSEHAYELSYSGGDIQFSFSFQASAAFPTLMLHAKEIVGKDMKTAIKKWAEATSVANGIALFLMKQEICTEKQLFEGELCEHLENRLLLDCREHFMKKWGMFLNAVSVKRKIGTTTASQYGTDPYQYIL